MTKQEKAALVSIATNSVLTLAKFTLASITASIALLAEAYHSFADILSSTMVLLALRVDRRNNAAPAEVLGNSEEGEPAAKPRSRLFTPGNWENKAAIGIGILLIIAAINIFGKVSQSGAISVRYPLIAAVVVGFLALCSYFLYRFEVSVGKDTNSMALVADGRHAQTDMLASALVVIALIAARFGLGFDRIAAGIIATYIFINAIHILVQAIRSYSAIAKGHEFSRDIIYEDILFSLVYLTYSKFDKALWEKLGNLPGFEGPPDAVKRRFGRVLLALTVLIAVSAIGLSGIYILQPGERAIVERFGKPLQTNDPLGPGLHYHWPWPVECVKKADVEGVKRLTIGYKTGDQTSLILWTNKHYLSEYSIITGEGPFLDIAMNVHYRIKDLYQYLFNSAKPDVAVEKLGYQILRETLGTRPFFSSITSGRDALEDLILKEMQRRADKLGLGLLIQNVCFRDLHPPTQVAPAFEDVVSAQEDYETFIEQAHGYRKDLLPHARASAATALNDAEAYRNALTAQSAGKAQSFVLQHEAYRKAEDLTRKRMLLETVEETLSSIPKYIIDLGDGDKKHDLWFSVPPFVQIPSPGSEARVEEQQKLRAVRKTFRINEEEDLIDAVTRFQQERTEAKR